MGLMYWLAARSRKRKAVSHLRLMLRVSNQFTSNKINADLLSRNIVQGACEKAPIILFGWDGIMLALAALHYELSEGAVPENDIGGCLLALNSLATKIESESLAVSPDDRHLLAMTKGFVHEARRTGDGAAFLEFDRVVRACAATLRK